MEYQHLLRVVIQKNCTRGGTARHGAKGEQVDMEDVLGIFIDVLEKDEDIPVLQEKDRCGLSEKSRESCRSAVQENTTTPGR